MRLCTVVTHQNSTVIVNGVEDFLMREDGSLLLYPSRNTDSQAIAGFAKGEWISFQLPAPSCDHDWQLTGYGVAGPQIGSQSGQKCAKCGHLRMVSDSELDKVN